MRLKFFASLRQSFPRGLPVEVIVAVVLLPGAVLLAHRYLGEAAIYIAAMTIPALVVGLLLLRDQLNNGAQDGETPYEAQRVRLEKIADRVLSRTARVSRSTGCLVLRIDDYSALRDRLGLHAADQVQKRVAERLTVSLRHEDSVGSFGDGIFAVVLCPIASADLEVMMQIASRLQGVIAEPSAISGQQLCMSASVGFCQPERLTTPTGPALIDAAESAMLEASALGRGSVRAYSVEMDARRAEMHRMTEEIRDALEQGQITPWFQPQVSTDTGQVTGFEALARWVHPSRGNISPGEFLPVLEQAGLMNRLSEVILYHSLSAIKAWGAAGLHVPTVGVNFSSEELRAPNLVDKIAWELDRFELEPQRLTIEILESVISEGPNDIIAHNVAALAKLGCQIDLDDFGTGHSSITNIRRFDVSRLKIDRSFVSRVHEDREQQQLVTAILTMAERLNLDTLAEGVESEGEHTMLAQLGCGHIQGFGLARPMPFDETISWLKSYNSQVFQPPAIGRQQS